MPGDRANTGPTRRAVLAGTAGLAGAAALGIAGAAQAADASFRISVVSSARIPTQRFIDEFRKRNPGTRINLTAADLDQLQPTTRMQLASGTAPDIITVWPGNGNPLSMLQIAPGGYLESLQDQPFAARVPKQFASVTQYNGKLMFLPLPLTAIGCIYNVRVWNQLGLQVPQTWNDFLAVCDKIKAAGKVPIALGLATPWITQLIAYALVATTVYGQDRDFDVKMKSHQANFVKSGWMDALAMYMDLDKRGYFNPTPNGTSYEDMMQMLAGGNAVMAVLTTATIPAVYNYAGNRDFAIFALPGAQSADKVMIPAAPGSGYGLNAKSQNKAAALAFLNFMAEPDSIKDYSENSGLPSLFSTSQDGLAIGFDKVLAMIDDGRSALFMDQNWPNARVQQTMFSGIQDMFAGRATPEAVLARMDDAYTTA